MFCTAFLQRHHHVRVVGVVFLAVHVLQQTTVGHRAHRVERQARQQLLVFFEVFKAGTGNTRHRALQAQFNQVFVQADAFEQLGTAIAGDGGNTHLGQHFHQALVDALAVVLQRFVHAQAHVAGGHQVDDGLVRQVRVNGGSAVTQQARHLVRVTHGAGFGDDVGLATQAGVDQRVVHGADSE